MMPGPGLTVELSETPKPGEIAIDFATMPKKVRREVRHKFVEQYVRSRRRDGQKSSWLRAHARILWDRAVASKSISGSVVTEGGK
jgi:hypothetical protein